MKDVHSSKLRSQLQGVQRAVSESYGSFNLSKFGQINYKEFDEPSKSYGSFGLLKFEQTNYKDFNEQAKAMEVLICPNLGRLTTRTSMSKRKLWK